MKAGERYTLKVQSSMFRQQIKLMKCLDGYIWKVNCLHLHEGRITEYNFEITGKAIMEGWRKMDEYEYLRYK